MASVENELELEEFDRKSFPVKAVQVKPDNIELIAKWCAGKIMHDGDKEGHLSRDYIKVRVAYPINERQTQAYLGDWVLKSGKSFKVYTNTAFEKSFTKRQPSPKPGDEVKKKVAEPAFSS